MPSVASLEALHRAAADFAVTDLSLVIEPSALAAVRRSLDESGFLLVGEVHGVRGNPLVVRALMQAFGLDGLALEWPEELTPMAGHFSGAERWPITRCCGSVTAGSPLGIWRSCANAPQPGH